MNEDPTLELLGKLSSSSPKEIQEPTRVTELRKTLGLDRCTFRPFSHQVIGVEKLLEKSAFALFDEMGAGKTKQVIDGSQILFERNIIDRVLIIAPASVRSVWFDPDFGEIHNHLWEGIPACILELHAKPRVWGDLDKTHRRLFFFITNYEYIRSNQRLPEILELCNSRTLLVLDESSAVKSYRAKQTIACLKIRKACSRVVILNGTPIANNPGDLYSQANIMDPKILDCSNWFQFRARYGILGGWQQKQIVAWRNIDDLQKRLAPYVLRRLKDDCIDLPPKMPPVVLTVPLTETTWKHYKEMRDEMVAWLNEVTVSSASQAIVKVMRLAQITSGFLGGIEEMEFEDADIENPTEVQRVKIPIQEIGREKLDFFLSWLDDRLEEDLNFKIVAWSRFKAELERCVRETKIKYPSIPVGIVAGGYKPADREFALRLLDPRTAPKGPAFIYGNPQSGGLGLNMTAASYMFRISSDYSHFKRKQSDDRIHRPGQTKTTNYFDLLATGPQGQKTIDHITFSALSKKEDLAELTTSAWIHKLMEE
jgi:hypothetical protein